MASLFQEQEHSKVTNLSIFRPLVSILKLRPTYLHSFKVKSQKIFLNGFRVDILNTRRQPLNVFIEHLWKQRFGSEWAVKVICSLTVQSQISEENHFLFLAQKSASTHILTFMLSCGVGSAWKLKLSFWHVYCWTEVQPLNIISFNHSLIKFSKERHILLLLSIHKVFFCSDNHFPSNIICQNIFFSFYPFIKSSFAKTTSFFSFSSFQLGIH